jgi:hypothetical protein
MRKKNAAAAELGSLGGKARWAKVSKEEHSRLARKAVQARWAKRKTKAA